MLPSTAECHSMLAGFSFLPSVSSVTAGAALETTGIAPAPGWQQALTVPSQVQLRKEVHWLDLTLLGVGRSWKPASALLISKLQMSK